MWKRPFEASVRFLKVTVEDEHRMCVLVLGMEWDAEVAEGLPRAHEADAALRAGDFGKVQVLADTDCRVIVQAPAHDGDTKSKLTLPQCHLRTVDLLAHKDKDDEVQVRVRPVLAFRASDEALLFFAHHLGKVTLRWKLELRQLDLPISKPKGAADAKA